MNHQDALTTEAAEGLAGGLWPESGPLRLTRLHSENHQVYRVEGVGLDVVLNIEGKDDWRAGAIAREYEAATKRVAFFRDALHDSIPIDMKMVFYHWLIFCIDVGMWLADQRQSIGALIEYMGYFEQLKAAGKAVRRTP